VFVSFILLKTLVISTNHLLFHPVSHYQTTVWVSDHNFRVLPEEFTNIGIISQMQPDYKFITNFDFFIDMSKSILLLPGQIYFFMQRNHNSCNNLHLFKIHNFQTNVSASFSDLQFKKVIFR